MSIISLIRLKLKSEYNKMRARDFFCLRAQVINNGVAILNKYIIGKNNLIQIGHNSLLGKCQIRIKGNNNILIVGENCSIGKNCSFWLEGNNIRIEIGSNSTFTHSVHFCAQEDNVSIVCGKDCMFSNTIVVRTSDSHPIFDMNTDLRINSAKSVTIGNHVWIAPGTKIMKGAIIHDGAIIGSNSMVTREIPGNTLAVGMPAKVVKENIYWTRNQLF